MCVCVCDSWRWAQYYNVSLSKIFGSECVYNPVCIVLPMTVLWKYTCQKQQATTIFYSFFFYYKQSNRPKIIY